MRVHAVQQVDAGESPEIVVKALGISCGFMDEWLARYWAGGWEALKAKPISGRTSRLTDRMPKWVYGTVGIKDPAQLKFAITLWSQAMVACLIARQYGSKLSVSSVGRLLGQLGLTCQRLLLKADE